jgi:hypothetical protein
MISNVAKTYSTRFARTVFFRIELTQKSQQQPSVVAGFISAHPINQASLFRVFAKIKPPTLRVEGLWSRMRIVYILIISLL